MVANQAQANPIQQNAMARAMLINTGLYMTKMLQPVTAQGIGQQIRIPLDRMGIMTGVLLKITVPLNITATATPSEFAPYNLVNQISYTDYAGLQRINTSGFQLQALNQLRGGRALNNAVTGDFLSATEKGLDTNILSLPTATGTANLTFFLYVPIAIDPHNDLRGAVLSQTIYGDHYITITLPQNFVGSDSLACPYTAGTVALQAGQNITVQAYQHYIMPQGGVQNLPTIDLSTIYALEGGTSDSASISAGMDKYINWPNNRAILSAIHIFNNGGAGVLNQTDISNVTLLGNGNTNIRELTPDVIRNHMRYLLGYDLASGVYYLPSRHQPITTQLYGNVQTKLLIATANAGCYFSSQYESTYLSGTPLPGVIQQ